MKQFTCKIKDNWNQLFGGHKYAAKHRTGTDAAPVTTNSIVDKDFYKDFYLHQKYDRTNEYRELGYSGSSSHEKIRTLAQLGDNAQLLNLLRGTLQNGDLVRTASFFGGYSMREREGVLAEGILEKWRLPKLKKENAAQAIEGEIGMLLIKPAAYLIDNSKTPAETAKLLTSKMEKFSAGQFTLDLLLFLASQADSKKVMGAVLAAGANPNAADLRPFLAEAGAPFESTDTLRLFYAHGVDFTQVAKDMSPPKAARRLLELDHQFMRENQNALRFALDKQNIKLDEFREKVEDLIKKVSNFQGAAVSDDQTVELKPTPPKPPLGL